MEILRLTVLLAAETHVIIGQNSQHARADPTYKMLWKLHVSVSSAGNACHWIARSSFLLLRPSQGQCLFQPCTLISLVLSGAAYRLYYNLRPTSVTPITQIRFLLLTSLNDSASFPLHSRIHVVRRGAVRPISYDCRPIDEERGQASARTSPFDISHNDNSRDSPPIRTSQSASCLSSQVQSIKVLGATFIDVRLGPCRHHGLVPVSSSCRAYTDLAIATYSVWDSLG